MDRMEEFTSPIRKALEARPAYTLVALSLGFSLYRWNSKRVGNCSGHQLHRAEECPQVKVPAYGSEIPVLSLISAIRSFKCMNDILADAYNKVDLALGSKYYPLTSIAVSDF